VESDGCGGVCDAHVWEPKGKSGVECRELSVVGGPGRTWCGGEARCLVWGGAGGGFGVKWDQGKECVRALRSSLLIPVGGGGWGGKCGARSDWGGGGRLAGERLRGRGRGVGEGGSVSKLHGVIGRVCQGKRYSERGRWGCHSARPTCGAENPIPAHIHSRGVFGNPVDRIEGVGGPSGSSSIGGWLFCGPGE